MGARSKNIAWVYPLEPSIKHYDWGSVNAIEGLFAIPNPLKKVVAELWYGTHKRGSSSIIHDKEKISFSQFIKTHKHKVLGNAHNHESEGIPFLLKIISAEHALSIQAHPNKMQAEHGFIRENNEGINSEAGNRSYRDKNYKPECLIAMEDFWVLSGFQKPLAIIKNLEPFIQDSVLCRKLLDQLTSIQKESEQLRAFYTVLMMADVHEQQEFLSVVLQKTQQELSIQNTWLIRYYWVRELHTRFPQDIGCLAPLYLNIIKLSHGSALFMHPGILHAYLCGTGIEIMASSDNVLRGGCTNKHVNREELCSILDFHAHDPCTLERDVLGWFTSYVPDFQIAYMKLAKSSMDLRKKGKLGKRMAIFLLLKGKVVLQCKEDEHILCQGNAVFLPAINSEDMEKLIITSSGISLFILATTNI